MRTFLNSVIPLAVLACTTTPLPPHNPPPDDPPTIPTDPNDPTDPTDPPPPPPLDCDATAAAGSDLDTAAASLTDGEVLCLDAGLHPDGLSLVDRGLTVQGLADARLGGAITASGGAVRLKDLTFEDTSGGPAIRLANTVATLEDVTVLRGAAAGTDASGGIDARSTDLTVLGLEIADIVGTGMIVVGGSLAMDDAEIRDCDGTFAGGLIASQLSDAVLTDVRLTSNEAGSLVGGAEIRLTDRVVLDNVTIEGNLSTFEVGGMYVSDVGDVEIRDSRFADNEGGFTGGFEIWDAASVLLERAEIRTNGTLTPSIQGGFTFANVPDLTVRDTVVEGHRASVLPAGGTTLNVTGVLEDVVFRDNQSQGEVGGFGTGFSSIVMRRPVFENNAGTLAGGAYCGSGDLTIELPQFSGNTPVPWGEGPDCVLTDATPFEFGGYWSPVP